MYISSSDSCRVLILSPRSKYQMIFDPRCRRASNKGATAQAEHVTGTHLFEYLQDAAMVGSVGPNSGAESADKVTEIYEVRKKEILSRKVLL